MTSLLLLALLSCKGDKAATDSGAGADSGDGGLDPYDVPVGPYDATVRWTSYGIPHITASDYGSLGYGMGYAFARDNACILADQIVMVRSERSRYFGDAFVDDDFGWLGLGVRQQAEDGWFELSEDSRAMLVGYAAGYNALLAEGVPDPRCAGQDWVKPITHIDLLNYYLALGLYGSGLIFVDGVGSAAPPDAPADSRGGPRAEPPTLDVLDPLLHPVLGSNGWAIGRDRTAHGGGMLLSNTHFPSQGERRWHESHLTIPGEIDVYGVSLMGVAVINIGFNEHVAWTHTVSNAPRFTGALLQLEPGNPQSYLYDGAYEAMTTRDYSIEVADGSGGTSTVTRTLYFSRWGPVLNAPVLGWNELYALALSDANENNLAMIQTWFGMNQATSLDAFKAAQRDIGGIPWVHTMATDTEGNAFYVDSSTVPNWSDAAEARYPEWLDEEPLAALFDENGATVVDGSDPVFQWVDGGDGAWRPGVVPWDEMPKVDRTDFVFNSNDNHWLPNPASPLEGYPYLYGPERYPRTPRTRMNARYLDQVGEGSASGEDGKFTLEELQAAALGGRGMIAEELKDDVVTACFDAGSATVDGSEVDLTLACETLRDWDGTVSPDQKGAALWREFVGSGEFGWMDLGEAGELFTTPFDPDDPVDTPTGLNTAGPIATALGRAVVTLDEAGFAPDVALRDIQFMRKDDEDLPVPGGNFQEGVIAISEYSGGNATLLDVEPRASVVNSGTDLTTDGYQMNYGNSFIMAVAMGGADGPECQAILTYSQSTDPASPHFDDQTRLYGERTFRPCRYREADIAADVTEEQHLVLD
ncbi:MAG: penicillin acylase family protein [Alphaproteobacteria bacterium]|nr:penicillin acylase family protein [Alphaproteobacteria bacterium]